MKSITIKNTVIGEGIPKICVPIVGKSTEDILAEAVAIQNASADIVEWRMDFFEHITDIETTINMLSMLREAMPEMVILATFRSKKEGGEKDVDKAFYVTLNKAVCESGIADMIDIEVFTGEEEVVELVSAAHQKNVIVIMSNHDFFATPAKEEIISRLMYMQSLSADIPKIAVMPTCKEDVLTLLSATNEMYEHFADRPIITMSMAGTGVISRMCGEVFGSAISFGAVKKISAPGQVEVEDLRTMLTLLHKNL